MYLQPDGWRFGENIQKENDTYTDSCWPGCEYRLPVHNGEVKLGVNIIETGKTKWQGGQEWKRVKIEFVGDGEPSTFCRGWILDNNVPV
jgi:hypothetical protein